MGEEMKEHFLLLGDLAVPSAPARVLMEGGTGAIKAWEAALRGAVKATVPGLDDGQEALQVSVWDARPDPFFFPSEGTAGGDEGLFKVRTWIHVYVCMYTRT